METNISPLSISLGQADEFDRVVHGSDGVPTLRDAGDLAIVTKDEGTKEGRAIACLHFSVEVDGKLVRAQTVTSVRLLVSVLHALLGRYGHEGKKQPDADPNELALDATQGMPPGLLEAMKREALALAILRLGGKMVVSGADTMLSQDLKVHIGFDAKTMSFNLETKRAQ